MERGGKVGKKEDKKRAKKSSEPSEIFEKEIYEELSGAEPLFLKEIDTGHRLLADVEPEFRFWLSDGRVIKNLDELIEALKTMNEATFSYHVNKEKNDFSSWIREILKDKELADRIRNARKKEIVLEIIKKRKEEFDRKKQELELEKKRNKTEIDEAVRKAREMKIGKKAESKKMEVSKKEEEKQAIQKLLKKGLEKIKPMVNLVKPEKDKIEKLPEKGEIKKINELKKRFENESGANRLKETEKGILGKNDSKKVEKAKKGKTDLTAKKISEMRKMLKLKPLKMPQKKAKMKKEKIKIKAKKEGKSTIKERESGLNEKEKWLNEQERKLNERRLMLSRMRIELIKKRSELEKEKFDAFMKKQGKLGEKITSGISDANIELTEIGGGTAGENQSMKIDAAIGEARNLLMAGKKEEAKSKLGEIKSSLKSMYLNPEGKRKIEYAMMELEADVKLAML